MKKAIIVGATSGIGKQLAILLADKGYTVGVTGRREALLLELQTAYPDKILPLAFDVTDTDLVSDKLDELSRQLGGLDLLVLSSGVGDFNETLDFAIEKKTIDVNVTGFTAVADWSFRFFEAQGFGQLAAISSIGGIRGSRQAPAYNASKAFQINYLEGLRQKAARTKKSIYITDLQPGFVDTEMAKGEGQFWGASAQKAARQILKAIESRKAVAYVTKRWRSIAALLKVVPGSIYQKL